jgi:hypothetical protein
MSAKLGKRGLVAALGCFACASPPSVPPAPLTPAPPHTANTPPADVSPVAIPNASAPDSARPSPAKLALEFERVSDLRVSSAAAGKPPKVAFLTASSVLVFDAKGSRTFAAPETESDAGSIELFFGRDDAPRLMGYRRAAENEKAEPFYRRFKAGRFQPEPSELGPLAAPEGALYGVLGHADPEVVCRPGSFCLVKRTTGWSRAPAHAAPVRILLAGGTAWALHRDRVERLGDGVWSPLEPARAWRTPVSLFVDQEGAPWVVEAGPNLIVRRKGTEWQATRSPLSGARAIWGTNSNDVWLVGDGGAAHFDGAAWSRVPGAEGSLSFIVASPPDLWLAGESGVFHGAPPNVPR